LRNAALSFRGVVFSPIGKDGAGFEAIESSDGRAEMMLMFVAADMRRARDVGRDVKELSYGCGASSMSVSMLAIGSLAAGKDISEMNDVSPS
jgi:hypothetical protein